MPTNQSVTPQFLLQGSCYALEQCGILLHDATTLYIAESYPSAVVLAAFAREELGRCRILRSLRMDVLEGKPVTISLIKKWCEDHVQKQAAAQLVEMMSAHPDSELGKLMDTHMSAELDSDEFKKAHEELEKIRQIVRKRTPSARHEARERALYVEPNDAGASWHIPRKTLSKQDTRSFILYAINDYAAIYVPIKCKDDDEDGFTNAIQEWNDRPDFPPPPFRRL